MNGDDRTPGEKIAAANQAAEELAHQVARSYQRKTADPEPEPSRLEQLRRSFWEQGILRRDLPYAVRPKRLTVSQTGRLVWESSRYTVIGFVLLFVMLIQPVPWLPLPVWVALLVIAEQLDERRAARRRPAANPDYPTDPLNTAARTVGTYLRFMVLCTVVLMVLIAVILVGAMVWEVL